MTAFNFKRKYEKLAVVVSFRLRRTFFCRCFFFFLSFLFFFFFFLATFFNSRAQHLVCLLNHLLSEIVVAVAVVVCLGSLLIEWHVVVFVKMTYGRLKFHMHKCCLLCFYIFIHKQVKTNDQKKKPTFRYLHGAIVKVMENIKEFKFWESKKGVKMNLH